MKFLSCMTALLFVTIAPAWAQMTWEDLEITGATVRGDNLVVDPSDPNHIYFVATIGGEWPPYLFESKDGAATWQKVMDVGVTDWSGTFREVHFLPGDPNTIYVGRHISTDGGQTWEYHGFSTPIYAIHPSDPDIMYRKNHYDWREPYYPFMRTTDGGATWDEVGPVPESGVGTPTSIALDPNDTDVLYCTLLSYEGVGAIDNFGVFKSIDGGDTWAKTPLHSILHESLLDRVVIDPGDSTRLLASVWGGGGGIYLSEDSGDSWTETHYGAIMYLLPDPYVASRFYAFSDRTDVLNSTVHLSYDGGQTWDDQCTHLPELAQRVRAAAMPTTGTLLAAMDHDNGVSKSTDQGMTWQLMNEGLSAINVSDVYVHPENPDLVFLGTQRGAFRADMGTWSQGDPVDWEIVTDSRYEATTLTALPGTGGEMLCTGFSWIHQSLDYGETWSNIYNAGPGDKTTYLNSIYASENDPGRVIFAGADWDSKVAKLLTSGSSGTAPYTIAAPAGIGTISWMEWGPVGNSRILYAGCKSIYGYPGGILRSMDEGDTWEVLSGYQGEMYYFYGHSIAVDPNNGNVVYAGNGSGGYTDGGDWWAGLTGELPIWLQLERSGNDFTARLSSDGSTWQDYGSLNMDLPSDVYVGLAVSANFDNVSTTATFENVTWATAAPWSNMDIGEHTKSGGVIETAGQYEITAYGHEIYGRQDAFHYAYQQLSGDGVITARLVGFADVTAWSKAGLMVRETLTAGSRNVFAGVAGNETLMLQQRSKSTDVLFLEKSVDAGDTWEDIGPALEEGQVYEVIRDIEIDPSDSSHIFFTTGSRIYESTDAGDSWTLLEEGLDSVGVIEYQPPSARRSPSGLLFAAFGGSVSVAELAAVASADPNGWMLYE
ncbi:hypothetical protein KQI84_03370 [bacterium]|nr:hypothetical protein [bacterium]